MILICSSCGDAFEVPDELIGDNVIDQEDILCDLCDQENMVLIEDLDEDDIEYDDDGFEVGYQDRGVTETFGNQ